MISDDETGLKGRVARQGEEALGRIAQELLDSPIVSGALSAAFETRERAMRAQEVAMGALNLPSAADLERLTRRVRSVSQRLEGIEDGLDRLDERLQRPDASRTLDERLTRIEAVLERLESDRTVPPATPTAAVTEPAPEPPAAPRRAAARSASPSTARSSAVSRAKSAAKTTGNRRAASSGRRAPSRKPASG